MAEPRFLSGPKTGPEPRRSLRHGIETDDRPASSRTPRDIQDAAQPLVRFVKVQKTYDGETLVIKNLNLDIARGEFVTLLGPSGSGKTTCLLMLAGFETVTHGEIVLAGHPITRVPPYKRDIGMVFQNYALFPHMTVEENVAYRGLAAALGGILLGGVLALYWLYNRLIGVEKLKLA